MTADLLRVRLDLAYDGTDFVGWAAQPALRSVEGTLSEALTTVLRAPEPVRLTVAGRTDAGVHARGQVCHADVDPGVWALLPGRSDRPAGAAAVRRLNGVLPGDIVVRRADVAPPGFDARFSATSRCYRYLICDDPAAADPLLRHLVVTHPSRLDETAMDAAARSLVGLNDFAAFCKRREGATTVRTLLRYEWRRVDDHLLEATVMADAFCHSMVRALVGGVVPVGEGRVEPGFTAEVLAGRQRDPRVKVMPAHGLSLEEVTYPADADLAARAVEARARRTLAHD